MEVAKSLPAKCAERKYVPNVEDIFHDVCAKHSLEPNDLVRHKRVPRVVWARNEFYFRALTETCHSFSEISHAIGRDHSCARYGALAHAQAYGLTPPRGLRVEELETRQADNRKRFHRRKRTRVRQKPISFTLLMGTPANDN